MTVKSMPSSDATSGRRSSTRIPIAANLRKASITVEIAIMF
jgi:hypothetical protein